MQLLCKVTDTKYILSYFDEKSICILCSLGKSGEHCKKVVKVTFLSNYMFVYMTKSELLHLSCSVIFHSIKKPPDLIHSLKTGILEVVAE